jgi:hypothetical protein
MPSASLALVLPWNTFVPLLVWLEDVAKLTIAAAIGLFPLGTGIDELVLVSLDVTLV